MLDGSTGLRRGGADQIAVADGERESSPTQEGNGSAIQKVAEGKRMLVIEEDESLRRLLQEILEEEGHTVIFADSKFQTWTLKEKIDYLKTTTDKHVIDGALTDLPIFNTESQSQSKETVIALKATSFPDESIIGLSTLAYNYRQDFSIESFFPNIKVFRKPFDLEEVLVAVEGITKREPIISAEGNQPALPEGINPQRGEFRQFTHPRSREDGVHLAPLPLQARK